MSEVQRMFDELAHQEPAEAWETIQKLFQSDPNPSKCLDDGSDLNDDYDEDTIMGLVE